MSRPNPQLEAAIARLQEATQQEALKAAIRADDALSRNLNEAAKQGYLTGFSATQEGAAHSIGSYDMASGVVTLPATALNGLERHPSDELVATLKLQDMSLRFSRGTYVDDAGVKNPISQEMIGNLQDTINASPVLAAQLRKAVNAEPEAHLKNFAILDPGFGAGGTYDGDSKTMNLPAGRLLPKSPVNQSGFNPDNLTFVIGHEVQHGFNHQGKREAYKVFDREVRDIARDRNPINDYTAPISKLIQAGREDEARAEVAGWNAVVSRMAQAGTLGKLDDVLASKASQVHDFIEMDASRTATPRGGLVFSQDFGLEPTPANISAMERNYFDKAPAHTPGVPEGRTTGLGPHKEADYPNYYGRNAIERVVTIDRKHAHAVGGIEPQMHIDMTALRLNERLIERLGLEIDPNPERPQAYYDTGQSPPALHHFEHTRTGANRNQHIPIDQEILSDAPVQAPAKLIPSQPGHADHLLYSQIADRVREQDRQHGRQWDETSERLTASLLVLAKGSGLSQVDHVVFSVKNEHVAAGENVFVVQGRLDDPAHLRTHMKTDEAARTPEAASFEKVEAVNERIARQTAQAQALGQTPEETPKGPGMGR